VLGTFLPEIEIWNLDVLNTIEPALILGEEQEMKKKLNPKKL
jgi:periodic tryptophan protein 1